MDTSDRRALLETIVAEAQTEQARLKALELLDRLDQRERERTNPPPQPPSFAEWYANDPGRLARLLDLAGEHLFNDLPEWKAAVERRAEELVEERAQAARDQFVAVEAQDATEEPEAEERDIAISEPPEAASEPEEAAEDPPTIPPAILQRQWPSKRSGSSLRNIPPSRIVERLKSDLEI
jgi:hypothetical protein